MEWIDNKFKNAGDAERFTGDFSRADIQNAYDFHTSMPQYESTHLHELRGRAQSLGLGALYIKDESTRFGLNAFKGLGAAYAMARHFAGRLNQDVGGMSFNSLTAALEGHPFETFVTATEGNHGKGVAWGAKIFGQQGKVFLPKGAAGARVQAVTDLGADAEVTEMNYDDTVQYAAEQAKRNGWILMQDTAWEGYMEIPLNIMQGYTTIISEVHEQLGRSSSAEISHVVLQAGVGSFAGAMAAALYRMTDGNPPKIIIIEPEAADPIFRSADSMSGQPIRVHGEMETVMAGLSCGAPSPIGWNILKSTADHFVSCDDSISDKGMRMYGRPYGEDPSIISGASGAVPLGFLAEVMTSDKHSELKKQMALDESSKVLLFNTEGNTDPGNRIRVMKE
ncbi:diaminopropionate ammonia-lyase [Lacicoccus alkaliphilus]|uniref:Diaminopropionate ammonia-lyase n=1 Tax=Lacicoccus alkaliphilus DSM 16010 TaxID=1123231 RepID=A0A1M7DUP8_9BACL|nr:diaminopropionate ammonia-lyase [Salinicoccus alkaliphilus]SHL83190.1 diaminopropionate ammonia-lyase [Salinicoccus alkaliphilus DSM 16010]